MKFKPPASALPMARPAQTPIKPHPSKIPNRKISAFVHMISRMTVQAS